MRERVWQQLSGHPEGPVTALTHAGCLLLLIHDRPTVWLEVSAGSDERLSEMLPGALREVFTPRFGPESAMNTAPAVNTPGRVHTPDADRASANAVDGTTAADAVNPASRVNIADAVNTANAVNPPPPHAPPPVFTPPPL